jgi:hypothetical protein
MSIVSCCCQAATLRLLFFRWLGLGSTTKTLFLYIGDIEGCLPFDELKQENNVSAAQCGRAFGVRHAERSFCQRSGKLRWNGNQTSLTDAWSTIDSRITPFIQASPKLSSSCINQVRSANWSEIIFKMLRRRLLSLTKPFHIVIKDSKYDVYC